MTPQLHQETHVLLGFCINFTNFSEFAPIPPQTGYRVVTFCAYPPPLLSLFSLESREVDEVDEVQSESPTFPSVFHFTRLMK